jgi:hypothetical protein
MKKLISFYIIMFFFMTLKFDAVCQSIITGPTCVLPNVVYQYSITGSKDSISNLKICVQGGVFLDSVATCASKPSAYSFVRITWNSGINGRIQWSSKNVSQFLNVSITNPLDGGAIIATVKSQIINYDTIPNQISCSASVGGGCTPQYQYQWQESMDNVTWINISNANSQNLTFSISTRKAKYYRRMVKEKISGAIAYSDVANVFPILQIPVGTAL